LELIHGRLLNYAIVFDTDTETVLYLEDLIRGAEQLMSPTDGQNWCDNSKW